jgi:CotH kinase protein
MKIKGIASPSSITQAVKGVFGKRNGFIKAVFAVLGIGVFGVIFLAAISYGAFLQKRGQTPNLKNFLIAVSELDFAFIPNFGVGMNADIDRFDIEIKFKHQLRIQYLRELAFSKGIIDDEIKAETFPAKLNMNGEVYNIKLSLTGLMLDHLRHPTKWSYQIKVKGDKTINGMKRFTIMFPRARGYLTDWVATELCKERGLIGLRTDFVDVNFNGKPIGLYYMEEKFDKYLLESNRMREGIIFKIRYPQMSVYGESKMLADPAKKDQLIRFKQLWQAVVAGDIAIDEFFNLEKMAKIYAITDLMKDKHAMSLTNLRLYFNPVTGLAEPIGREWEYLRKENQSKMELFLEKPTPASRFHEITERDTLIRLIYDNNTFKKYYLKEADEIAKEEFLKNFFERIRPRMKALLKKIYRENPFYKSPESILIDNQKYIRKKLYSDLPEISAYFYEKGDGELRVFLKNQQDLPIAVSYINWADSVNFFPTEEIILGSKWKTKIDDQNLTIFAFPSGFTWSDSMVNELKISYNILGLDGNKKEILVFPWNYKNRSAFAKNPVNKKANYQSFEFITEKEGSNILRVPSGEWTIDRELIIPEGKEFVISPGTKIDLIKDGQIISKSPFNCLGTKEEPIVFSSSDSMGRGILILSGGKQSLIYHTTFENLAPPSNAGWKMSGSVTFYESPVNISNVTFASNRIGDDCLNIIRSEFEIDHSLFKDTRADAFDCDFCDGTVNNTSFINIGNDAVDISGTEMKLNNIIIKNVGDKGLSAGENSEMTVKDVQITDAEIAITSKDKSLLTIENAEVINSTIGIAAFQKKSEFGPGTIVIKGLKIEGSKIPYLIEQNSSLTIDNELIPPSRKNVKEILYGAEYGKSSK